MAFGFRGLGLDNNVHAEYGGLLHVLPLTVHLQFFIDGQVGWTILDPKITVSPFGFIGVGTGFADFLKP